MFVARCDVARECLVLLPFGPSLVLYVVYAWFLAFYWCICCCRLVDDVLGEGAGDKVPMEKVVMLIWQFRDDPSVVTFLARFIAKVGKDALVICTRSHIRNECDSHMLRKRSLRPIDILSIPCRAEIC
jgi:hypothetical protein